MNYSLSELLDLPKLKDLLDSLNAVQHLPSAIVDIDGKILTATNWQDICVKFHRCNPQTKKNCVESDLHIEASLDRLKACTIYRCPMGLIDAAIPIMIEGQHLGNIYSGQLFLEPPDENYFRKQAQKYNFNEKNYLQALQKVPLFSEKQLRNNLTLIHRLVQGLAEQGLQFKHQLKTENKLRHSKEKYQRIFENLQEVYYEANLKGELLEISPSIQALSQYTREELIGKSLKDLYVDSNAREHFLDRLLTIGRVKNYPIHLRDKDGTHRYCAITTSLLKDDQGIPFKLIGSIRDMSENEQISEQLQRQIKDHETSQKLLKESEERFKALHEASFGGVVIHDKGLILDCNQGLSDITGFSIAELIGMQGLELIAPDSLDQVLHNIKSGATDRYEVEGMRKDGSIYPLSIKGKNVQYKGREARVIEFRDITDIKRAETELRKSESTRRAMLENIIDVILIIDRQGINRFKSANIEKWFGWKPTELIGEPVWDKIHPQDLTSVKKSLATILNEADTVKTGECRYRCRDGEYKWIEYTGVNRLHDADITGILMSFHDISERKEHEREKLKIDKLESIGLLAGGIAHDFNNILAALYGNISLARLKVTKEHPAFKYIEAASKSMNRATLLTNQLLTFAKGGDPVKNDLSLVHLIEEIAAFHLSGSNVKPDILYSDNLWLADADQGQIQQVFANLTINAMHAMPDGGTLRIELENMALRTGVIATVESGKYIRIRFCDEGIGITPEHLPRIFDPYFTTKESGSGLGLATSYSIITKHGGQITVESQLDKGTTFTLYLPATLSRQSTQSAITHSETSHHQNARILLMDDEESIRHTISSMLKELNFTVETAKNETQTLNLYRHALTSKAPFDLVILDMTIPGGKGGKEVARSILKLNPDAKLIVSSGYTDAPVMANYSEYGFKGVITKPYDLKKLSAVLAQILSEPAPKI